MSANQIRAIVLCLFVTAIYITNWRVMRAQQRIIAIEARLATVESNAYQTLTAAQSVQADLGALRKAILAAMSATHRMTNEWAEVNKTAGSYLPRWDSNNVIGAEIHRPNWSLEFSNRLDGIKGPVAVIRQESNRITGRFAVDYATNFSRPLPPGTPRVVTP